MARFRRIADRDRIFFVTTNLGEGVPYLNPLERDMFLKELSDQRSGYFLWAYVVMPSHVHLLLSPRDRSLIRIMRDLKSKTGFTINRCRGTKGAVWQSRYFDNIIRRVRNFWEKLEYIHNNPVEAGIVNNPDFWKWSSYRYYSERAAVPVTPDPVELPADKNALLWPAPWR